MNIPYNIYARIKNNICLAYLGYCADHVFLLKLIRPTIEKALPGLSVYLCCRNELMPILEHEDKVVPQSELDQKHKFFGYVKMVLGRMKVPHPMELLLEDVGCSVPTINTESNSNSRLCCLFTSGELPTQSLSTEQIERQKSIARFKGYDVWVNPDISSIHEAGWVIGVESLPLFKAAAIGVKTSLIATGIGTKVYQKMFPNGEIIKQ